MKKFTCQRCGTTFWVSEKDIEDMARQELSVYCPRCMAIVVKGVELRIRLEAIG